MTQPVAHPIRKTSAVSLSVAIQEMLEYFSGNPWFVNDYWPENAPRVKRLLGDLQRAVPAPASVFEPGCGNGFISFLAGRLGYQVTATDGWQPADREDLFRRADVHCFKSNLNDLVPWPFLSDESFDVVLFGEVFEHLLNQPLGILREIHRVLRPGGTLLLTTPNPSTLGNAIRVLLDHHSLWGTQDFACTPKIQHGEIIDNGDIHYREYRSAELRQFLALSGFQVDFSGYVGTGSPTHAPVLKRLAKRMFGAAGLMQSRLFAISNYIVATAR
jgi:SAM-dependent methyltransferase